jgi:accessory gene regulator B
MERISRHLTNWLVDKEVIQIEEKDVYEYGISQLMINILDTLSIFLLAIFFHKVVAACFYIICFCMLRKYAGGYHARRIIGCYIITVGSAFLMLIMISFWSISIEIITAVWLVSGIIVFLFAPVQNVNKKLDDVECMEYRRRAIIIWILESALMWVLLRLGFSEVAEGILFGDILIVISMLVESSRREEETIIC